MIIEIGVRVNTLILGSTFKSKRRYFILVSFYIEKQNPKKKIEWRLAGISCTSKLNENCDLDFLELGNF